LVFFFGRLPTPVPAPSASSEKAFQPRPAKLSGVLTHEGACSPGYYQVNLQGLAESAHIQVETQTDQSGRFQLTAPPGQYLMMVGQGECGSRETVVLEENTEHMMAVAVRDGKRIDKVGNIKGRLPASVLVPVVKRNALLAPGAAEAERAPEFVPSQE
jgi:hypothetical protein